MSLLYAIIGLLVGAVLNVLADTMPLKARLRPPHCIHCKAQRRPAAWLATLSYVLERGRCAACGERQALRGVLTELATALAFALIFAHYDLTGHMLLLSAYVAILILVTIIDLEHRLVLNRVIGPAILLALIASPFTPDLGLKRALVGGMVGFFFFYVVAMLKPGAMGAGDVKLAAFIGLITGFPVVVVALLVTLFAGGGISLLLVITRIRSTRDYIPYGPFLVIGGIYALFWGQAATDDYLENHRETRAAEITLAQQSHAEPCLALEPIDWSLIWKQTRG